MVASTDENIFGAAPNVFIASSGDAEALRACIASHVQEVFPCNAVCTRGKRTAVRLLSWVVKGFKRIRCFARRTNRRSRAGAVRPCCAALQALQGPRGAQLP